MADHYHYPDEVDAAARDHTHYDLENLISGLREDLGRTEARISELEEKLHDLEQLRHWHA